MLTRIYGKYFIDIFYFISALDLQIPRIDPWVDYCKIVNRHCVGGILLYTGARGWGSTENMACMLPMANGKEMLM